MTHSFAWLIMLILGFCAAVLVGCAVLTRPTHGQITQAPWGKTADGTPVTIYTLRNSKGAEARISDYGGTVVSVVVPDRHGQMADVVLGYDDLDGYLKNSPFFGCVVGRYANRIATGKFTLDGKTYTLAINNPPNALHGGPKGFDKKVWDARILASTSGPALELRYRSPDGEEGYPGNLSVIAVYTWSDDNALKLEYTATTDKETVVNFSQHSYFNLAGHGTATNHVVKLNADKFLPVDNTLIPTGELRPVAGTPFDFRTPTTIGARINDSDEQMKIGNGYDHCWVISKPLGEVGLMARVTDPASGRVLEVISSEPGVQFYTANGLGGITGKGGWTYKNREAFCLEPQHYPDSPNRPEFPSVVLKVGETFQSTIIYRFSTEP